MGYVIVARWTVRAGSEDRLLEIARELMPLARAEPGCRYYQGTRDPENPRSFLFFEIYDDEAAFDEHRASPHFQKLVAGEALDLLEDRERWTYETID